MRNLGTDAVLSGVMILPRAVVFRVRREDQHHVELQAGKPNLNVAFLQDVEQTHLNLAGKIGQFVDREDAAVGSRQQPGSASSVRRPG